jgi:hypothetical protein
MLIFHHASESVNLQRFGIQRSETPTFVSTASISSLLGSSSGAPRTSLPWRPVAARTANHLPHRTHRIHQSWTLQTAEPTQLPYTGAHVAVLPELSSAHERKPPRRGNRPRFSGDAAHRCLAVAALCLLLLTSSSARCTNQREPPRRGNRPLFSGETAHGCLPVAAL